MNRNHIRTLTGFQRDSKPLGRSAYSQGTVSATTRRTHSYTLMLVKHRYHTNVPQQLSALTFYLCELIERQLEAAFVVGDTLGNDALHSFF